MSDRGNTYTVPTINFKNSEISIRDVGNQNIIKRVLNQTITLALFNYATMISWAADKFLKKMAYPIASISFVVNAIQSSDSGGNIRSHPSCVYPVMSISRCSTDSLGSAL